MILLSLVWACTDKDPTDTGNELLEMGRISGVISVDNAVALPETSEEMEETTLFAFASVEVVEGELLPHRIYVAGQPVEFLDGEAISYQLVNLFPQDDPYLVLAMLDLDDSIRLTGQFKPTPGDVLSVPTILDQDEVAVSSGAEIQMDLLLQYIVE